LQKTIALVTSSRASNRRQRVAHSPRQRADDLLLDQQLDEAGAGDLRSAWGWTELVGELLDRPAWWR
jgi:hypothetical protein